MLCILILINTILNVLNVECLVNTLLGTTRLAGTRYMINYRQKKRIVTSETAYLFTICLNFALHERNSTNEFLRLTFRNNVCRYYLPLQNCS